MTLRPRREQCVLRISPSGKEMGQNALSAELIPSKIVHRYPSPLTPATPPSVPGDGIIAEYNANVTQIDRKMTLGVSQMRSIS